MVILGWRVAVHEAGHCVAARLMGLPVVGASIEPAFCDFPDDLGAPSICALMAGAISEALVLGDYAGHGDDCARWTTLMADAVEAISEALQGRRAAFAARGAQRALSSPIRLSARRKPTPRSPDKTGQPRAPPPPGRFRRPCHQPSPPVTTGELAALTVIARQCQRGGACSLPIDALAALAGVSRTTVQNALRAAKALGLIFARERRRPGLPSLTNVLRVSGSPG